MLKTVLLQVKNTKNINGKLLLTDQPILDRGMNLEECKAICTSPIIPLREKVFFRIIYETQFRPFEVLNLLVENWERELRLVTAVRVKQKTAPGKGDMHKRVHLPSRPRTAVLTENTNEVLRKIISNRKKGFIFVNEKGKQLTMPWFKMQINYYAKLLGIQRVTRYYNEKNKNPEKVHPRNLVTCMALREAGERHHDNAGGSRKLSAVSAGHSMPVKEKHYEKVGADFEQVWDSMKKFHPAFVEDW